MRKEIKTMLKANVKALKDTSSLRKQKRLALLVLAVFAVAEAETVKAVRTKTLI